MRYQYPLFTIPFSLGLISITVGLQIKSIFLLKEHSGATEDLTSSTIKITKLAKGYVSLFLAFMASGKLFKAVCFLLPKGLIAKPTINFLVPVATIYTFLHNPPASIIFLATNTKSHQYLKKKFRLQITSTKRLGISMATLSNNRVPNVPNKCSPKLHLKWKVYFKAKTIQNYTGDFVLLLNLQNNFGNIKQIFANFLFK